MSAEAWTAALSGALFLATIALFFATRQLVKDAKETSERQLRAYVNLEDLDPLDVNQRQPETVAYYGVFRNFGLTPAYDVEVLVHQVVIPVGSAGLIGFKSTEGTHGTSRTVLPPGGSVTVAIEAAPLTPVTAELMKAGSHQAFIMGRVRYRDAFGKERYSTLKCCRVATSQQMLACRDGNDAT
jgi:hypothetical protein